MDEKGKLVCICRSKIDATLSMQKPAHLALAAVANYIKGPMVKTHDAVLE
jgi:hypothetical protein